MIKGDGTQDAVDMLAEARSAQVLSEVESPGWIELVAPAKVNLVLNVGDRLDSGYHRVSTILHALNLHDTVFMRCTAAPEGSGISVAAEVKGRGGVSVPEIASADNLAAKAVALLARAIGRAEDERVEIRIDKRIPAQAGLGGGSSDAAAALVGACRLWGVDPSAREVRDAACEVGSDVAFFLQGGCAAFAGKGDGFVRSLRASKRPVVLVKPERGVSTVRAYQAFDEDPVPADGAVEAAFDEVGFADDVPLFNNLALASEGLEPELSAVRCWLEGRCGAGRALLCGSGSCTFALCESFDEAVAVSMEARKRGWWSRATSLGPLKAAVVR